jgi:hypothetical protein
VKKLVSQNLQLQIQIVPLHVGTRGDVFYWKQRRDEKQYGVVGLCTLNPVYP